MIKITKISSPKKDAASLVLIPGGPGLSSNTLRSMDILHRDINLIYVDFPGVNDNPYGEDKTFNELSLALAEEVQKISGPIFVLGHSYGGLFAADLVSKTKIDGVVCVATPFSERSFIAASENYETKKTEALRSAEMEWELAQDDKSFAKWLSEYGELYFVKSNGKELLLNDKVSARFFLANRSDIIHEDFLFPMLKSSTVKKLFIAGKQDSMLPESILKEDAIRAGFNFISIKNASHFVTFDQAEIVSNFVEEFIRQKL